MFVGVCVLFCLLGWICCLVVGVLCVLVFLGFGFVFRFVVSMCA